MQQLLIPQQFADQPMLQWNPPNAGRQEVSARVTRSFGSADFACSRAPASCWSMGSPSSSAAALRSSDGADQGARRRRH